MRINNLFDEGKTIYVFWRGDDKILKATKYDGFFPYFYSENPEGIFKSYTGKRLQKVIVSKPQDIRRQRTATSWEADINFVKRFLIDKVDSIEKSPLVHAFVDIEVQANELPNTAYAEYPISCISIWDSLTQVNKTFFLGEYDTEFNMLNDFIAYLKKIRPDVLLAWNMSFDWDYMFHRIPDLCEKISVIGKSRYGHDDVRYPAGMAICDYLTWFKLITLGREKQYTLENIAQKYLKDRENTKVDFSQLTPELKEKNANDVLRLVKLEEKFKLVEYYDEIRRLTKVEWEDLQWNSRMIDMLLLDEAKKKHVVLPCKPSGEEDAEFAGAYRDIFATGLVKNVYKADLSSAYPLMIVDFCLDTANISKHEEGIKVDTLYFKQNPDALLPSVIRRLIVLKNNLKKELKTLSITDPVYKSTEIKYNAIKGLVNTSYGVTALKFFRLFDDRVASSTTFMVRSLLHYVEDKMNAMGHKVVYVDTDSVMYLADRDYTVELNQYVQEWCKSVGKDKTQIEFAAEGKFESLLLLAKCRYVGLLRTMKGELETETKGVESKRKDSTEYIRTFTKELINKILKEVPKDDIFSWIKEEIKNFQNNKIMDIAFPCKLAKQAHEYKNIPIFVRAMTNTPEFKAKVGDNFYYIFMKGQDSTKKEMVKAFNEDNFAHINKDEIDWQRVLERNIIMKLDVIFEAMKWDIKEIYLAPATTKVCPQCTKEKSLSRFPETGLICSVCAKHLIAEQEKPKLVKKTKDSTKPLTLPKKDAIIDTISKDDAIAELKKRGVL